MDINLTLILWLYLAPAAIAFVTLMTLGFGAGGTNFKEVASIIYNSVVLSLLWPLLAVGRVMVTIFVPRGN